MQMHVLSMPLRHWAPPPSKEAGVLSLSVLVVFPHLLHLPVAVSLLCAMCWVIGLLLACRRSRLSKVATIGVILIVLSTLSTVIPQLGFSRLGFALAVLMVAMKPLETFDRRGNRSFAISCYLCSLLFFFQEGSALWAVYYLCCFIGLTGFLCASETPDSGLGRSLGKGVRLLAQALPLAVVLFYGIPRIEQPFLQWGPSKAPTLSGVPDKVRLDRLGPMSESDDLAFEAAFDGPAPDPFSLYWRGTVFHFTDGIHWDSDHYPHHPMNPWRLEPAEDSPVPAASDAQSLARRAGKIVSYRISKLEASDDWLIALDLPVAQIESSTLTEDYQLIPHGSFGSDFEYRMTSALSIRTPQDPERVYRKALQLPSRSGMARQARQMGERLRAEHEGKGGADQRIIQQILRFFSQEGFHYTLNAPIYRSNPIDQFLFEGRYGYCTHYAAATTLLLRAAGVPARMISGYHGGDWSPDRKTLMVRQRHAHAWVEAWVEGHGWLRIDPTAAIPPERVLTGSVPTEEMSVLNHNEPLVSQGETAGDWRSLLNPAQLRLLEQNGGEATDVPSEPDAPSLSLDRWIGMSKALWTSLVTDYDRGRQQSLFQGDRGYLLAAALLFGSIALSVVLALIRARRPANGGSSCRVGAIYGRLCRRLQAGGIPTPPHEPYQSLHERLARTGRFDPELLDGFFSAYEHLRYRQEEAQASREDLRHLRGLMKRLLVGTLPRAAISNGLCKFDSEMRTVARK